MKSHHLIFLVTALLFKESQSQVIVKPQAANQSQRLRADTEVKPYRYKNVISGELLELTYDPSSGCMYNKVTGKNVDFFINASTGDTVAGKGFYIVNLYLQKHDNVFGIDRTKVDFKGKRMWDIRLNKELKTDKGYMQFYKTKSRETALNEL